MDEVTTKPAPTTDELIMELSQSLARFPIGSIWLDRLDEGCFKLYKVVEGVVGSISSVRCIGYTIKSTEGGYEYSKYDTSLYDSPNFVRVGESTFDAVDWAMRASYITKSNKLGEMSCLLNAPDKIEYGDLIDRLEGELADSKTPFYLYYLPTDNVIRLAKIIPDDYVGEGTMMDHSHITLTNNMCMGGKPGRWQISQLAHNELYPITEYQYEQLRSFIEAEPLKDHPSFMERLDEIWKNQGE